MLNFASIQTVRACNKYKACNIAKWVTNYMFTDSREPLLESGMGGDIVYKEYRGTSGDGDENSLSSGEDYQ
jgi:hypothetical protein